jgi:hypothetical protein
MPARLGGALPARAGRTRRGGRCSDVGDDDSAEDRQHGVFGDVASSSGTRVGRRRSFSDGEDQQPDFGM